MPAAEKLCAHLGAGRRADGLAGGALRLAIGVQPARQDVARAAAWQQRHACGKLREQIRMVSRDQVRARWYV